MTPPSVFFGSFLSSTLHWVWGIISLCEKSNFTFHLSVDLCTEFPANASEDKSEF